LSLFDKNVILLIVRRNIVVPRIIL